MENSTFLCVCYIALWCSIVPDAPAALAWFQTHFIVLNPAAFQFILHQHKRACKTWPDSQYFFYLVLLCTKKHFISSVSHNVSLLLMLHIYCWNELCHHWTWVRVTACFQLKSHHLLQVGSGSVPVCFLVQMTAYAMISNNFMLCFGLTFQCESLLSRLR